MLEDPARTVALMEPWARQEITTVLIHQTAHFFQRLRIQTILKTLLFLKRIPKEYLFESKIVIFFNGVVLVSGVQYSDSIILHITQCSSC